MDIIVFIVLFAGLTLWPLYRATPLSAICRQRPLTERLTEPVPLTACMMLWITIFKTLLWAPESPQFGVPAFKTDISAHISSATQMDRLVNCLAEMVQNELASDDKVIFMLQINTSASAMASSVGEGPVDGFVLPTSTSPSSSSGFDDSMALFAWRCTSAIVTLILTPLFFYAWGDYTASKKRRQPSASLDVDTALLEKSIEKFTLMNQQFQSLEAIIQKLSTDSKIDQRTPKAPEPMSIQQHTTEDNAHIDSIQHYHYDRPYSVRDNTTHMFEGFQQSIRNLDLRLKTLLLDGLKETEARLFKKIIRLQTQFQPLLRLTNQLDIAKLLERLAFLEDKIQNKVQEIQAVVSFHIKRLEQSLVSMQRKIDGMNSTVTELQGAQTRGQYTIEGMPGLLQAASEQIIRSRKAASRGLQRRQDLKLLKLTHRLSAVKTHVDDYSTTVTSLFVAVGDVEQTVQTLAGTIHGRASRQELIQLCGKIESFEVAIRDLKDRTDSRLPVEAPAAATLSPSTPPQSREAETSKRHGRDSEGQYCTESLRRELTLIVQPAPVNLDRIHTLISSLQSQIMSYVRVNDERIEILQNSVDDLQTNMQEDLAKCVRMGQTWVDGTVDLLDSTHKAEMVEVARQLNESNHQYADAVNNIVSRTTSKVGKITETQNGCRQDLAHLYEQLQDAENKFRHLLNGVSFLSSRVDETENTAQQSIVNVDSKIVKTREEVETLKKWFRRLKQNQRELKADAQNQCAEADAKAKQTQDDIDDMKRSFERLTRNHKEIKKNWQKKYTNIDTKEENIQKKVEGLKDSAEQLEQDQKARLPPRPQAIQKENKRSFDETSEPPLKRARSINYPFNLQRLEIWRTFQPISESPSEGDMEGLEYPNRICLEPTLALFSGRSTSPFASQSDNDIEMTNEEQQSQRDNESKTSEVSEDEFHSSEESPQDTGSETYLPSSSSNSNGSDTASIGSSIQSQHSEPPGSERHTMDGDSDEDTTHFDDTESSEDEAPILAASQQE